MKTKQQREMIVERIERQTKIMSEISENDSASEFHSTIMEDKRLLAVLDIAENMTKEEMNRIKAIPAWENNWSAVKDIKVKYNLSWGEMKWIRKIESEDCDA